MRGEEDSRISRTEGWRGQTAAAPPAWPVLPVHTCSYQGAFTYAAVAAFHVGDAAHAVKHGFGAPKHPPPSVMTDSFAAVAGPADCLRYPWRQLPAISGLFTGVRQPGNPFPSGTCDQLHDRGDETPVTLPGAYRA